MVYVSGGKELLDPEIIYESLGLAAGMKVADLGCGGSGLFTIKAANFVGDKGIVYAVDILKSILSEVAKKARLEGVNNIKTIWADLETPNGVKIENNALDMAFLVNVLFQAKEHEAIIKEAVRIIKSKGVLLIIDWQLKGASFGPPLIDRVKPSKLKKIANNNKLKLISEFDAGRYHFGLILQKS